MWSNTFFMIPGLLQARRASPNRECVLPYSDCLLLWHARESATWVAVAGRDARLSPIHAFSAYKTLAFGRIAVARAIEPPPQHLGQQEAGGQHGSCSPSSRYAAASPTQVALLHQLCIWALPCPLLRALRLVSSCMWAGLLGLLVQRQQRRRIVRRGVLVAAVRDEAHDGNASAAWCVLY